MKVDRYNPNLPKVKKEQLMLYSLMKERKDNNLSFTKEDLLDLYKANILIKKRPIQIRNITDEQIYHNATSWMRSSIFSLIKRGYIGLTFREPLDALPV